MSPSRGPPLRLASSVLHRLRVSPQCRCNCYSTRALPSTARNANRAPAPAGTPPIAQLRLSPHRLHIYRSTSTDPFFNLSAEDYLLRHSPADSTILFTYTNARSVVIGRNQNPWAEINMPLLRRMQQTPDTYVHFVRRRSGGGTVYHDLGNLCWSVIMPGKAFDRDKYARVVVKALQGLGVHNAAVNERHDIVLHSGVGTDSKKVSGSAYKIIRDRAYHHATLLLSSNLENIGSLLTSPLKPFLETAGVESVRSPVTNIGVDKGQLIDAIETEFLRMHEDSAHSVSYVTLHRDETIAARTYIKEGMGELKSVKWLYSQTPRFTLRLPTEQQLPELHGQPFLTPTLPEYAKFTLLSERGQIVNAVVSISPDADFGFVQSQESHERLLRTPFAGPSITATLAQVKTLDAATAQPIARWLGAAVGEWAGGEWQRRQNTLLRNR
ncbi:Biotin/lipoate A/B protein ligase, variant 4 [Orbilia brochopaga]|uniref:Putative lipoate-protein ligase A n=1 Tax=Orbilia brochopaga TaxID=3140254 RepID=A0AAV9VA87_9PEZI